jgi:predicted DNA repair protein MutK
VSIGLIALLDDVAGLAKVAAGSIDDVSAQAGRAGTKAAGVVIDDAAVTPSYVVGLSPARELPIIGRIAVGSLRNKLLFLLPAALALSFLAPWAITPLLMLGGAYLCYEGTEKIYEAINPPRAHADAAGLSPALNAEAFEERKVASAIKTDFILSAEIMAITLAAVPEGNLVVQALVLALVGTGITAVVYGVVALLVKADDLGLALIANGSSTRLGRLGRALGRGLVLGMPVLLKILGIVGTAAMIWVGGGILVHGLEGYGLPAIGHTIHHAAEVARHAFPQVGGAIAWAMGALGSGVVGLLIGAALIPVTSFVLVPVFRTLTAAKRANAAPHGT